MEIKKYKSIKEMYGSMEMTMNDPMVDDSMDFETDYEEGYNCGWDDCEIYYGLTDDEMESGDDFYMESVEELEEDDKSYYKKELDSIGNIDEYGARMVVHGPKGKTKHLNITKDLLDVFMKWTKAQKLNESVELEEEKSDEEKAKDAIKGIIEQDWGGSNSDQYAAIQLLSGLSSNNSDIANKFMSDLNKLTDKMDLSKYGIKGN